MGYGQIVIRVSAPIQILLSTYNGEKYLSEQLASLEAQQDAPNWSLLWRDDGSSDVSASLLRNFPRATELIDDTLHLGPAHSFLRLLASAPEDAEAFAFCDQDDVWLPDKLSRAWLWISAQPPEVPALYFSRQQLVDEYLRPIGLSSPFRRTPGFKNALAQNIATGCTIMVNAAARKLILSAPSLPARSMHDWWTYLLISGAGGLMYADPHPTVLYRQHRNNAIGSSPTIFQRICGVVRRGRGAFLTIFNDHLAALDSAGDLLTSEAQEIVAILQAVPRFPLTKRFFMLKKSGLYRQSYLEDFVFRVFILLGSPQRM